MPATPHAIGESRGEAGVDNFAIAPHAASARRRFDAGPVLDDSTTASGLAVRFGPAPGSFALTSPEDSRSK